MIRSRPAEGVCTTDHHFRWSRRLELSISFIELRRAEEWTTKVFGGAAISDGDGSMMSATSVAKGHEIFQWPSILTAWLNFNIPSTKASRTINLAWLKVNWRLRTIKDPIWCLINYPGVLKGAFTLRPRLSICSLQLNDFAKRFHFELLESDPKQLVNNFVDNRIR